MCFPMIHLHVLVLVILVYPSMGDDGDSFGYLRDNLTPKISHPLA